MAAFLNFHLSNTSHTDYIKPIFFHLKTWWCPDTLSLSGPWQGNKATVVMQDWIWRWNCDVEREIKTTGRKVLSINIKEKSAFLSNGLIGQEHGVSDNETEMQTSGKLRIVVVSGDVSVKKAAVLENGRWSLNLWG